MGGELDGRYGADTSRVDGDCVELELCRSTPVSRSKMMRDIGVDIKTRTSIFLPPRNRGLTPPCTASKKLKLGLICDIVFQYTSGCWTRVSKVPANPPIVNSRAKEWFSSRAVEFAVFFDCLRESTSEEGVTAILCDESQYLFGRGVSLCCSCCGYFSS